MSGLMRKFLEGSSAHRDLDGEIRDGTSVKATIIHGILPDFGRETKPQRSGNKSDFVRLTETDQSARR
jgi:hypothetical protein